MKQHSKWLAGAMIAARFGLAMAQDSGEPTVEMRKDRLKNTAPSAMEYHSPHERKHAKQAWLNKEERFKQADTNHDGFLSKEEAQAAGFHKLVKYFDRLKQDNTGGISIEQFRAFTHSNHRKRWNHHKHHGKHHHEEHQMHDKQLDPKPLNH